MTMMKDKCERGGPRKVLSSQGDNEMTKPLEVDGDVIRVDPKNMLPLKLYTFKYKGTSFAVYKDAEDVLSILEDTLK